MLDEADVLPGVHVTLESFVTNREILRTVIERSAVLAAARGHAAAHSATLFKDFQVLLTSYPEDIAFPGGAWERGTGPARKRINARAQQKKGADLAPFPLISTDPDYLGRSTESMT
jgi:hypothetical protein